MAFPVVESSASGNSGASKLTHTITLPTGIAAGDLILVFFCNDGGATATVTTPSSGWRSLGGDYSGDGRTYCFFRVADGAEDSTITVTMSSTEAAAWTTYRVSGADTDRSPELSTAAVGVTVSPNPGSLTTSWGVAETLWFAIYGWDGNASHSAYPSGYLDNQLTNRWANVAGCGIATATKYDIDETENPAAATISSAEEWTAYTLAVRAPASELGFYRTVLEADSYFASQLYASDWTGASSEDKEKALLAATRAVDSLRYRGYKKTVYDVLDADPYATDAEILAAYEAQVNQFPRDTQAADTVPDDVFWAVCEEAMSLLSGKRPDQEFQNLQLTSDGVGSFRTSADRSGMPPKHAAHFITSPTAWKYLQRWLDPTVNSFTHKRA